MGEIGLIRPSRLYFAEDNRLRYITQPADPGQSTLGTLFTASGRIENFIFSLDEKQLIYLKEGSLYCRDLGSGEAWCDDTKLGPPTGLRPVVRGPDQLSWIDAQNLLISNYQGEIYQYTLSP